MKRQSGTWESTILPAAAEIVRSYDTPVTLRQLHYRLVANGLIRNTTSDYTQLSKRTTEARRRGDFPRLADRTRAIVRPPHWSDASSALGALADHFRVDRTEGQAYSVYLGVEKAGLVEQLRAWFGDDLGIPILPLSGYSSESFENEINAHVADDGRPSVLLYAGDLDPEGEDIERNFLRWTNFDVSTRVALTVDQAVEYELPAAPGKPSSTRAGGFIEKYGRLFQIEVDALAPEVLRRLFADAIARYWDEAPHAAAIERETTERELLREAA